LPKGGIIDNEGRRGGRGEAVEALERTRRRSRRVRKRRTVEKKIPPTLGGVVTGDGGIERVIKERNTSVRRWERCLRWIAVERLVTER
jgi:hypothetical protein